MNEPAGLPGTSLEDVAKTVAIGLATALESDQIERRAWTLSTFGMSIDPFIEISQDAPLSDRLEWMGKYPGGGTDFNHAFERGIQLLKQMKAGGVEGADLVFLTDGDAGVRDETWRDWERLAEVMNARLIYVQIGEGENEALKERADLFAQVDYGDFTEGGSMEKLVIAITEDIIRAAEEGKRAHREIGL
jgi:uncharacterized protein with von Willebrand factor type A (vWA) domain